MAETADFHAVLAVFKARRARLDQLIAGIEAEISGQTDTPLAVDMESTANGAPPAQVPIHPDTFFGLSIIEAARKFLKMARRAQHATAIAAALEQGGLKRPADNVLSGILVRAAKGREVVKVGKGMWGLSEWYPKPPKDPIEDRRKRPMPRKARTPRPTIAKAAKEKKATSKAPRGVRATLSSVVPVNGARPSDVALEVMREAGSPLHAVEITKRVNARGTKAFRLPIEAFLNRQAKAGKLQKLAPSIFALPGLTKAASSAS